MYRWFDYKLSLTRVNSYYMWLLGRDFVMEAYNHAVKEKYRFFSFGDAMFIS